MANKLAVFEDRVCLKCASKEEFTRVKNRLDSQRLGYKASNSMYIDVDCPVPHAFYQIVTDTDVGCILL